MSATKLLYSVKETADCLGVSVASVRNLAKEFHLEQRYIGRKMLITFESITAFVDGLPMLPENPDENQPAVASS